MIKLVIEPIKMKMRIAREEIWGKTLETFTIKSSICWTLVSAYKIVLLTGKNGALLETGSRDVLWESVVHAS